jgi:hypothetical protein
MAWCVVFNCENCQNHCQVIPLPLDWLAWLAAQEKKEAQVRSYDLYIGNVVMGVCPKKKEVFFSKFMG